MSVGSAVSRFVPSAWILALLQAVLLWLLHLSVVQQSWPATSPSLLIPSFLVALALPITLLVLWKHRAERTLWIVLAAMAGFLAAAGYGAFANVTGPVSDANPDEDLIAGFVLPLVLAWFIGLPMLRARLESGRWMPDYALLFRGSWRSYLLLAQAVLFTAVFWGLLGLWATLFEMLGNEFFKTAFADPRFFYPATTLVFATAIQLAEQRDSLVEAILEPLLGLLKWLAPLAGVIVIIFTIALLPRLPELFSSGERIINSAVLVMLVAVTVLLLNAAFRDGSSPSGYGPVLAQLLRVVPPLLVVVAATALYSIIVRTNDLGLTPARYWGIVTAGFAVLYALGYSIASLRSGPWFAGLQRVNPALAAVLFAALLISVTPLVNPMRLSVASQVERALAAVNPVEREGALRFLRFDAGAAGRQALGLLAAGDYAGDPALQAAASQVAALESRRAPTLANSAVLNERYSVWRGTLRILPIGEVLPASLDRVLKSEFALHATQLDPEQPSSAPVLIFIDVNADGQHEAILLGGAWRGSLRSVSDYRLFYERADGWALAAGGVLPNE